MREHNVRARFFMREKSESKPAAEMVEIRVVGANDTVIRKVKPEDTQRFSDAYAVFKGTITEEVGGTPLTDVPGVDGNRAIALSLKGIRNAEELAALDDMPAKNALGMGWLDLRKAAQNLLELNALKAERSPTPTDGPKITPAAKKLIEEKGLDASLITATGNNGSMTKGDVEAFIAAEVEETNASDEDENKDANEGAE